MKLSLLGEEGRSISMLNTEELVKLEKFFFKYKNIKAVYLFGSYAMNKENKFSDLDIGILLADGYNKEIKLDILGELVNEEFCNVDLSILNEVSLLLQFEIVKHNILIYKSLDFDSSNYYSMIVRKYLDFEPLLKIQHQYIKERILNGK